MEDDKSTKLWDDDKSTKLWDILQNSETEQSNKLRNKFYY